MIDNLGKLMIPTQSKCLMNEVFFARIAINNLWLMTLITELCQVGFIWYHKQQLIILMSLIVTSQHNFFGFGKETFMCSKFKFRNWNMNLECVQQIGKTKHIINVVIVLLTKKSWPFGSLWTVWYSLWLNQVNKKSFLFHYWQ